jgi:hypothetical protein
MEAEVREREARKPAAVEMNAAPEPVLEPIAKTESPEVPWLTIDVNHSGDQPVRELEVVNVDTTADLALFESDDFAEPVFAATNAANERYSTQTQRSPVNDDELVSSAIMERLLSTDSSERAAALADLAQSGDEDAYRMIVRAFDDPSAEVRNAAARALSELWADLAASFTRALREASPERRRKIGSAIAGSGLAANAINSLIGESRERTYDAFSILFLMAKAGEVQPLMQAISKHTNIEVRLTAIKLLALSNQPQVLPALRNLAAREALPTEVQSAVMEAIYLISTQTREVA